MPTTDKFISQKTQTDINKLRLKEDQIVMTRSGTIGNVSIVTKTLANKIFSDDLIRIECNNKAQIGYIYAFLKTSIGHKLITTNNYGSVISHLEPEHLTEIKIPLASTKVLERINNNIFKAFRLRDEANEQIKLADNTLKRVLDLPELKSLNPGNFEHSEIPNYSIKASKLYMRFEATYHAPIIDEILLRLKKKCTELTNIGDARVSKEIILPGRFKRFYVNKEYGIPFLGGKDILQYDPDDLKCLSIKKHNDRIKKELLLEANMILVTCSGTIGRMILTPKHFKGWSASQHIIRIVPSDDINPGYIYAFLASEYGFHLITRYIYGSVVDEIDDHHVAQISFPLLDQRKMDEIGNLVLDANEKRAEAYFLERAAIKEVEDCILDNQR